MSLIPQINRYDDFNYNEDFEESIAKTMDSCSEEGSTFSPSARRIFLLFIFIL
jgi:hypothetical protein